MKLQQKKKKTFLHIMVLLVVMLFFLSVYMSDGIVLIWTILKRKKSEFRQLTIRKIIFLNT